MGFGSVLADVPLPLQSGALLNLAPPSACAYFLDVDGTLLEIRPRPEDVIADHALLALLGKLKEATNGALGLVSGRKIDDIDRIVAPLVLPAAGLHGAEIRFSDGARTASQDDATKMARGPLADFVDAHPGLLLEDKGATIAVHFRQRPELASDVLAFLAALAQRTGLSIQEGKMVAELKQAHHDKGRGIDALLEHSPFFGRRPVFIGDDLTDESGFRFVNARGGISVRVGTAEFATDARYLLPDPSGVRMELFRLLESA